jgi:hypothetical protein
MSRRVRVWRLSAALLVLGALIAAAFLSGRSVALASHNFSDVPDSAFYHDFVDFLVQNGLTSGCGVALYCGENAVTRGQLAVFLKKLALLGGCAPDAVKVGPACVDKYEASVWWTQDGALIQKIRLSTVTAADLKPPGALQLGTQPGVFEAFGCDTSGNGAGCKDVYAVSIPGVVPSRFMSWFQAAAAARNAGKRLPTNAEWQAAALGTPANLCNTFGNNVTGTGTTAGCVSHVGAFDMVGNVWEWVADWVPRSTTCGSWGSFSGNHQCLAGAATTGAPGALIRGGNYFQSFLDEAGVFAVDGLNAPSDAFYFVGFRAAR